MPHWNNELVEKHKAYAIKEQLEQLEIDLDADIDSWFGLQDTSPDRFPPVESPLEAVFLVWFVASQHNHHRWHWENQFHIDCNGQKFRADFAIWPCSRDRWNEPPLIVELDGHAFHEKTPEQVAARNSRDRALQMAGYSVIHFSYREMTTRPSECIGEVLMAARMKFEPESVKYLLGNRTE